MILSFHHPVHVLWSSCFLSLFVAITSAAGPKLHCDAPKFSFGTVIGRDKITHEFVLTNTGDEPVVVSKIKNCCGVSSTLTPMIIPPGSNAVCKSVFTTKNRYGKQDKQILLATNLRRKPYFELKLTGTLLRPVDYTPRFVRLGNLTIGGTIEQTIVATNLLEQAVTLESVKSMVPGIEAEVIGATDQHGRTRIPAGDADRVRQNDYGQNDSVRTGIGTTEYTERKTVGHASGLSLVERDLLAAKRRKMHKDGEGVNSLVEKEDADRISAPRRSWTIRLSATDALTAGKQSGRVLLNFSTGTVTVPVMGTVKPMIQVVPEQIKLSGKSTKPVERLVMLRSEKPFDVLSAKVENAEGTASTEKVADGKWKIKLTIAPGALNPGTELSIETTCPSQGWVVVPLSVR